jgi:hypothetical protein
MTVLMMDAVRTSETSVYSKETTWRYNTEVSNLQNCYWICTSSKICRTNLILVRVRSEDAIFRSESRKWREPRRTRGPGYQQNIERRVWGCVPTVVSSSGHSGTRRWSFAFRKTRDLLTGRAMYKVSKEDLHGLQIAVYPICLKCPFNWKLAICVV